MVDERSSGNDQRAFAEAWSTRPLQEKSAISGNVKLGLTIGLTIGAAIIFAAAMLIYFSPFQTCVRAITAAGTPNRPELACAKLVGGR